MADTLPNTRLFKDIPKDLYAATGIDVGVKISVMNCGQTVIRLQTKATSPLPTDGWWPLYPGEVFTNDTGDSGAWATSLGEDDSVNVKVVS